MSSTPAPRRHDIDLARGLGIAAIVVAHCTLAEPARWFAYSWHVPIFFVLSGLLWKQGGTLADELRRRWVSLGRPYLAWALAILGPALVLDYLDRGANGVVRRLGSLVLGGYYLKVPFPGFWFFGALFLACLAYRWLETRHVPIWAIALGALALSLVGHPLALVPWSAGIALACLFFVASGHWFASWPARLATPWVGLGLVAAGLALTVSGVAPPIDLKPGAFGRPVLTMVTATAISIGLVLVMAWPARWFPAAAARASSLVSRYGAAVILAHGLPVNLFYGRYPLPVVLVLVFGATFLLVGLASLTPWRAWFLGLGRARPSVRPAGAAPGIQ